MTLDDETIRTDTAPPRTRRDLLRTAGLTAAAGVAAAAGASALSSDPASATELTDTFLTDLNDVTITGTPQADQVLRYSGSQWVNATEDAPTSFDDLPVGDQPDGTELLAALQDSGGVSLTAQQVSGHPADAKTSLNRDRYRGYEEFDAFSGTTNATNTTIAGTLTTTALNPNNSDAAVTQVGPTVFLPGAARLATGTTTSGRCALWFVCPPLVPFDDTKRYVVAATFAIATVSDASQQHECRVGFLSNWNATTLSSSDSGIYVRAQHGVANWTAVVRNNSTEEAKDLGVAVGTTVRSLVCTYDPVSEQTIVRLYDSDAEVLGEQSFTEKPAANANLYAGAGIFRTGGAGTAQRYLYLDMLANDVPAPLTRARIPAF